MPHPPKKRPASAAKGKNSAKKPAGGNPKGNTQKKGTSVEIFTASFCPHCQEAKFYFKTHAIAYKEYNLERSKEAEKRFRGYGGKAIPLIVVKGKILRRWDQKAFEKLYSGSS